MATNFPSSLDTSTQQPTIAASDEMDDSGKEHDVVHTNHSGAIIALETKLGSTDSNPSAGAVLMGTGSGTSEWDATPTFTGDVTIPDGDLILGSTAVTATAAEINFVNDDAVTWTAWTPTWDNITPNSATTTAKYHRVGDVVHWHLEFIGASNTVYDSSGPFNFTLPVAATTDLTYTPMGTGWVRPNAASTIYSVFIIGISGKAYIYGQLASTTYTANGGTSSSVPATWLTSGANADMYLSGWYRV